MKQTLIFLLILFAIPAFSQDKFFSTIPVMVTVGDTQYFLTVDAGVWKKFTASTLKKQISPKVTATAIGYVPALTGNTLNLNEFVTDTGGDVWFIDVDGNAKKLSLGGASSVSFADTISVLATKSDVSEISASAAFVKVSNTSAVSAYLPVSNGTIFYVSWIKAYFEVLPSEPVDYSSEGVAVILLTGGNYAVLQTNKEGSYALRHFGAIGDGVTADEAAIQKGFAFSRVQNKNLHGEQGDNYFMSALVENIDIDKNFTFNGHGCFLSSVSNASLKTFFKLEERSDSNIVFKNFSFYADAEHNVAIARDDSINNTNNVRLFELKNGTSKITFENVKVYNCIDALKTTKNTDSLDVKNIVLRDFYAENCSQSFSLFDVDGVSFFNVESNRVKMPHGQDHSHHTYLSDAKNVKFFNYRTISKVDSITGRSLRISHSSNIKLIGCTFSGGATTHIEVSDNISFNDCTFSDTKYIISGYQITNLKLNNSTLNNNSITGSGLSLFNALGKFTDIKIDNLQSNGKIGIELRDITSASITNSTFLNALDIDGTSRFINTSDNTTGNIYFNNVNLIQDTLNADQIELIRVSDGTDDTNITFDNCRFEITDTDNVGLRLTLGANQVGATQLTTFNNCRTKNINSITWGSSIEPHIRVNKILNENDEFHSDEYNIVSGSTTVKIENTIAITSIGDTLLIAANNDWLGREIEILPSSYCYTKSASGKLINNLSVFRVNGRAILKYDGTKYKTYSTEWVRSNDFLMAGVSEKIRLGNHTITQSPNTKLFIQTNTTSAGNYGLKISTDAHDHRVFSVDSDGSVLIGNQTAPVNFTGKGLSIVNTGTSYFEIVRTSGGVSGFMFASSAGFYINAKGAPMNLYGDNTPTMTMTGGNVRIGDFTTARAKLDVFGGTQTILGNYTFNHDQDTTGLDGQKLTFNTATGEIELKEGFTDAEKTKLSGIPSNAAPLSSLSAVLSIGDANGAEVPDIGVAISSTSAVRLDQALDSLYTQQPFAYTSNQTGTAYSSASALKINLGSLDANERFTLTTNTLALTNLRAGNYKVTYTGTVSSSISNEVEFSIYNGGSEVVATKRQIDNTSSKQHFGDTYIVSLSNTETIEIYVKSIDQAGSVDITVENISVSIVKI